MELYTGAEAMNTPAIMDRIHKCSQEILDAFVAICERHDWKYYIAAGTLLGAVRHQGPIPWDDDVDVYMPRADADAFKKMMLARPEGEPYHIQCYENEPTFVHFNIHFNKSGTVYKTRITIEKNRRYMEMWLDIFPLDNYRETVTALDQLRARFIAFFKHELEIRAKLAKRPVSFKYRAAHFFFKPIPDDRLFALTDRLMRWDNRRECDHYVSWTGGCPFPNNAMPKSWFEPACRLLYNGKYYTAPSGWDGILRQRYADYMKLPPEKKQASVHDPLEIGF